MKEIVQLNQHLTKISTDFGFSKANTNIPMNRNEQIKTFDLEFETFELQSEHSNYNRNIRITIKTFELQSKHSNYNQNILITIKTFELQSKHLNQTIKTFGLDNQNIQIR